MISCIETFSLVEIIIKDKVFHVIIGNANNTEIHDFDPHAPEIKCVQDGDNTFVLSILYSDLFAASERVAKHFVVSRPSSS